MCTTLNPLHFRFDDPTRFKVTVENWGILADQMLHWDNAVSLNFKPGKVVIVLPLDQGHNYVISLEKNKKVVFAGRYGGDCMFNGHEKLCSLMDLSAKVEQEFENAYGAWEDLHINSEYQEWYKHLKPVPIIMFVAFCALLAVASLFQMISFSTRPIGSKIVGFALGIITTLGAYLFLARKEKNYSDKCDKLGQLHCKHIVRAAYYLHNSDKAPDPILKIEVNKIINSDAKRVNLTILSQFINDEEFPSAYLNGQKTYKLQREPFQSVLIQ
jgi:hypothetical protein